MHRISNVCKCYGFVVPVESVIKVQRQRRKNADRLSASLCIAKLSRHALVRLGTAKRPRNSKIQFFSMFAERFLAVTTVVDLHGRSSKILLIRTEAEVSLSSLHPCVVEILFRLKAS